VAAACGDDPASPTIPGSVQKVSGDSQSVVVTTSTAQPMVVRILAQNGSPLAGATVAWSLGSAVSGTLASPTSVTGPDGTTSMHFTAGTVAGKADILATVGSLVGFTFNHTIVAGAPAALIRQSGDGAAGVVNAGVQVVARVNDASGNPVSGATVNWAVGATGGTLSATSSETDAAGLARVTITLGATPGVYTVTATQGTLPAVTFSVTAI